MIPKERMEEFWDACIAGGRWPDWDVDVLLDYGSGGKQLHLQANSRELHNVICALPDDFRFPELDELPYRMKLGHPTPNSVLVAGRERDGKGYLVGVLTDIQGSAINSINLAPSCASNDAMARWEDADDEEMACAIRELFSDLLAVKPLVEAYSLQDVALAGIVACRGPLLVETYTEGKLFDPSLAIAVCDWWRRHGLHGDE